MSEKAAALCNEGLELMMQHRWEEAEEKIWQAIKEDDQSPELWYNLGKCHYHQELYRAAIAELNTAIDLRMGEPSEDGTVEYPVHVKKYPEAQALLGNCYYSMGSTYDAWLHFCAAIHPDNTPEFNRECKAAAAQAQLARGTYTNGYWQDYQQRLTEPDTWDGSESLRGKTLLIKAEGGLGDQIFFARYKRFLVNFDIGHVLWEVDEPLARYARCELNLDVVIRGKEVPDHDFMIHAGSLPYIFGTKRGTIPVFHDSDYTKLLSSINTGLIDSIGIAWSGNPMHSDDHHRSIRLELFGPLFNLGKDLICLQKDIPHKDRRPFIMSKMDAPEFEDVDDMKDALDCVDLVITVDTMTAHLAGAEGVPTFLLLPYACDWRWGLEGDRTPWYPSIKIFRQGEDRKWEPVIQRVVEELNG